MNTVKSGMYPTSPPGQWKTFAVQVATNRPTSSECGVPEFVFPGLFSEYKKRNKSNKLKRSFLTLQCLYVLVTMISKIGDLEVEENNTKIS